MKKISELMQTRVVTVEPDDPLAVVQEIFDNTHFHHLLVVENNRLIGVLSDRDFFKAVSPNIGTAAELPRDSATLNKRIHQIMSRHPISIAPDGTVTEAVQLLLDNDISCLPVIEAPNHIAGIISWKDLLPELASRK